MKENLNFPDDLRGRILAAARHSFFTYGLRAVTMDALAKETGISKKTLYVHFPSKRALVREVLATKIGEIDADLAVAQNAHPEDPVEGLHALLTVWRRHLAEIQPGFLRDIQLDSPAEFAQLSALRRALIDRRFGGLLETGRRAGIIRDDVPTAFIVEMLMGAVDAVGSAQKLEQWNLTMRSAFTYLTTILIEGALSEQGRKQWKNAPAMGTDRS